MSGSRVIVKEWDKEEKNIIWGCTHCDLTFTMFHKAIGHCSSTHLRTNTLHRHSRSGGSSGRRSLLIEDGRTATSGESRRIREEIARAKLRKELLEL